MNYLKSWVVAMPAFLIFMSVMTGIPHAMAQEKADEITLKILIDHDNGFEEGLSFAGNVGLNDLSIPIYGLSTGIHVMSFRAKDELGNWTPTVTRILYVTEPWNLGGAEYFLDNDPGLGKGIALKTENNDMLSFSVATGGLETGLHTLTVRTRDDSFNWGQGMSKIFMVVRNTATIEWFYDRDPGIGYGNLIETDDGGDVYFIPTDGLAEGVHTLSVRTHDASGNWSTTVTHPICVIKKADLTKLEYYVDNDPGYGYATDMGLSPDGSYTLVLPTDNLNPGNHFLSIRGCDTDGSWIPFFENTFVVSDASGVNVLEFDSKLRIERDENSVRLYSENLNQGCSVRIFSPSGVKIYDGQWDDTTLPLLIPLDGSTHNCILTIETKNSKRITRRIR